MHGTRVEDVDKAHGGGSNSCSRETEKRPMHTASEISSRRAASTTVKDAPPTSIIVGSMEVRLARGDKDVQAAQLLRYRVFYEEMGATPSKDAALHKIDRDAFDATAEHLLVIDHSIGGSVIGTYRLMRRRFGDASEDYYTSREYDISKISRFPGEILELGRSCVDPKFRSKATMSLLWQGIAAYVFAHDIQILFGCASLPGNDPRAHAVALSYLHHFHRAPRDLRPCALATHYVDMNMLRPHEISRKQALNDLPPLIKGYLRLGGWVGDGAVIDEQFNTTDVCVVVRMESLAEKYFKHYQRKLHGEPTP
jgi:L-ornithine Nalpha-acyltransferase